MIKLILALLLLSGCKDAIDPPYKPKEDLLNYDCSPEDLAPIQKQYRLCNNSTYVSSHCYLTAVRSHCQYTWKEEEQ